MPDPTLAAQFSSTTRLYDLSIEGIQEAGDLSGSGLAQTLMVEAWCGLEALHGVNSWSILALSMDAHLEVSGLLGKVCQLHTALSDGSRSVRSGLITQAALLGSEGGVGALQLVGC